MVIIKAWKHRLSFSIGLIVILIVLLWPAIPLHSLNVWLQTLTSKFPTNVLYPIFAVLIGSYAALYTYDKKVARCCRVDTKSSAIPSIFGVILGACPACIPAIAFFLPLSVTIAIGYYSWIILLASVALILFSLWRSGAFQTLPEMSDNS